MLNRVYCKVSVMKIVQSLCIFNDFWKGCDRFTSHNSFLFTFFDILPLTCLQPRVPKTVNSTILCPKCRKPALPCTLINVQTTHSYKIYTNVPMHLTAGCAFTLSCWHHLCITLSFSINDWPFGNRKCTFL